MLHAKIKYCACMRKDPNETQRMNSQMKFSITVRDKYCSNRQGQKVNGGRDSTSQIDLLLVMIIYAKHDYQIVMHRHPSDFFFF